MRGHGLGLENTATGLGLDVGLEPSGLRFFGGSPATTQDNESSTVNSPSYGRTVYEVRSSRPKRVQRLQCCY